MVIRKTLLLAACRVESSTFTFCKVCNHTTTQLRLASFSSPQSCSCHFLPCFLSVYEAGKAVKKGVASQYAPTIYAPSMYGQPVYSNPLMTQPGMPMLPFPKGAGGAPPQNGYGRDYDSASSGWHLLSVFWATNVTSCTMTAWNPQNVVWCCFCSNLLLLCPRSGTGLPGAFAAGPRWQWPQWVKRAQSGVLPKQIKRTFLINGPE